MKVRIVKCSNDDWWYENFIGEILNVEDYKDENYYCREYDTFVLKSDCEVIMEDMEEKYGFYRMFSVTTNEAVVDMTWDKFIETINHERKQAQLEVLMIRDACNEFLENETGSFETSGYCYPIGAKNMVIDTSTNESTSCEFDSSQIIKGGLPRPDMNAVVGIPKEAQKKPIETRKDYLYDLENHRYTNIAEEKPKKLKYVCTACVGTKCKKKTIGVLPTNCKYPQANWKKVVK